jgi:hypothetical protein
MPRLTANRYVSPFVVAAALLTPRPADAQVAAPPRVFISINAGGQTSSSSLTTTSGLKINQEDGQLIADYTVDPGAVFDVGGGLHLIRGLWVGAAFSWFGQHIGADVRATIPHPFFFDRHRTIEGATPDVDREEKALHVHGMWAVPLTSQLHVKVFGGPTFLSIRQQLVSNVLYSETFPFDTATFSGAPTVMRTGSAVGVNAGADVTYAVTPTVGVGGVVRFSRGDVELESPLNGTIKVRAGGLHVGGGFRLLF